MKKLLSGAEVYRRAWFRGLIPPDPISVTEWAEKHRVLSGEGSIDPGPYRTDRTPYVREILDSLHPDSGIRRTVWMKGSQIGGSETGNNWIGFLIDQAPAPIMLVQPTLDTAKRYSSTRITPMLRDSPRLAEIMPVAKSRDTDNTTLMKRFRGGVLLIAGANSAATLRSQPIRYLMLDEVDNWPLDVDGEGDPVKLAEARLRFSGDRARIFMVSSPKLKGHSRIEQAFEEGDQRRFFVPCPHCDAMQWLQWGRIRWEKKKPETAAYECEACASLISEAYKSEMLERGEWRATAEPKDRATRSYHLSSLYSPAGAMTWSDIVREFEEAQSSGSVLKLQVFINTVLGQTWESKGEAPEHEALYAQSRHETYRAGTVPKGVMFLTAGVDVQKDRLECEVVGWGRGGESWSIEYFIFPGDHALPAVWRELDELLERKWPHESGVELPISRLAVDAAYNQSIVAKWVRRQSSARVMAVHGSDRLPVMVGQVRRGDVTRKGKAVKRYGFALWPMGSSVIKSELYARLRIKPPTEPGELHAPGFCHFPNDYGLPYFTQLCNEELVFKRTRAGGSKPEWNVKGRNEALDCRVMARAAANVHGVDRMTDAHWDALASELGVADVPTPEHPRPEARPMTPAPIETPRPSKRPGSPAPPARERGGWMKRWHGTRRPSSTD